MDDDELFPIPDSPGYLINRAGTRVVGPGGKRWKSGDLTFRPSEKSGHLRVKIRNRHRYVHELMALTFIGPRPSPAHEVRHLDDNKLNNADTNLAYGTRTENVGDSLKAGTHVSQWHKAKTHCPHNHEYTKENTYTFTTKYGGIGRQCKECTRQRTRERRRLQRIASSQS